MAEIAGLTVGAFALPSLFNNAVDWFEYVQLGKKFERDYHTKILQLDVAQMRLSRWGKAVGLGPDLDLNHVGSSKQLTIPKAETEKAQEILEQIIELFVATAKTSGKSKAATSILDGEPVEGNTNMESLHAKLKQLSIQRRGRQGLKEKTKWALYESKHFSRLVEDINDLVSSLVDLFPQVAATQTKLCEEEVNEISNHEEVRFLKEAAEGKDKLLEEAIEKMSQISEARSDGVSLSITGGQHSGFILGNNSGTISNLRWGGVP